MISLSLDREEAALLEELLRRQCHHEPKDPAEIGDRLKLYRVCERLSAARIASQTRKATTPETAHA